MPFIVHFLPSFRTLHCFLEILSSLINIQNVILLISHDRSYDKPVKNVANLTNLWSFLGVDSPASTDKIYNLCWSIFRRVDCGDPPNISLWLPTRANLQTQKKSSATCWHNQVCPTALQLLPPTYVNRTLRLPGVHQLAAVLSLLIKEG